MLIASEAREGQQPLLYFQTPQEQGSSADAPVTKSGEQPSDDSSTGRVDYGSQGAVLRAT